MEPWLQQVLTVVGSMVGGGGLVTIITKWQDVARGDRAEANKYLSDRVTELEKRDRDCNSRVTLLEQKNIELERENYRLHDRLGRIENSLITAVISADTNMKIVSWNEGATLMFGYIASDMIGQDVDILVPGYLKQRHHDAYEKAINDLDRVVSWINARPAVGIHKDGHEFNINLIINSFTNSRGAKFFEARISRPKTISGTHDTIEGAVSGDITRH